MYPTKKDPPRTTGVARYVVEKTIGGPTRTQETYPLMRAGLVVSVVPNNPDRVELVISNTSQGDITVGTVPAALITSGGILIPARGGLLSMNLTDDFTLPTYEWFAQGTVNNDGFPIYVLEIISDVILAPEGP